MQEVVLSAFMARRIEEIYEKLQGEYDRAAKILDFSCYGCPDNCCDSYFLHHTYLEWAYLWIGFRQLETERQDSLRRRSQRWLLESEKALVVGKRPQLMCPLNENGLCVLYTHRLLVCRTHGVPARMIRPDGQDLRFPGCFRCQEIVAGYSPGDEPPFVERTALLHNLAGLENELLQGKRHLFPKVRITIAEMLVKGPPALAHCRDVGVEQEESEKLQSERLFPERINRF